MTLRVIGNEKGSLKSGTVKCGRESQGTRTQGRLRWHGPAAYTKDRPVLSSEMAHHKNETNCRTVGAIIKCTHESCVKVANKPNFQSKTPLIVTHTCDNIYF
jgi:hypothetical protein